MEILTATKQEKEILYRSSPVNFHVKIKAGKYSLDQKNKYHPDWNSDGWFVTIIDGDLSHFGECKPSSLLHVFTKARTEKYVGDISSMALYTLCNTAIRTGRGITNFSIVT